MTSGRFLFGLASVAVAAALVQSANAAIIITTNMNGADAELREDVNHQLPDLGGVPQGSNRGTQTEIATRIGNTQSSTFYMKFDISSLTPADLVGKKVNLQLHVHSANLPRNRLVAYAPNSAPHNQGDLRYMEFDVRGLDPNMVDGLGNPNNHNAAQVYEWGENTITYFNAPGISPDSPDGSSDQTLGELDFNSDAPLLGKWRWQDPKPQNHLAVGAPLFYPDNNGNLKQLVLDAMAAGKGSVTVMIAHALPNDPLLTPGSMLGFNYIVVPKDRTSLNNDSGWDADGSGPAPVTGSPYSCLHSTNCPGGVLGDNTGGAFSPKLIIWVPEPSSMALLALGSLASLALVRRRRK